MVITCRSSTVITLIILLIPPFLFRLVHSPLMLCPSPEAIRSVYNTIKTPVQPYIVKSMPNIQTNTKINDDATSFKITSFLSKQNVGTMMMPTACLLVSTLVRRDFQTGFVCTLQGTRPSLYILHVLTRRWTSNDKDSNPFSLKAHLSVHFFQGKLSMWSILLFIITTGSKESKLCLL